MLQEVYPRMRFGGGTSQTDKETGRIDKGEDIKISIIIPMYNASKTIERCILSCIPALLENWEILVIDDGSVDSSYDIACSMSHNDERIKVFKKDNGGVSSTRNYGLHKAKGKYILFADADDVVNGKAIKTLIDKIEATDGDVIQGGQLYTREENDFERLLTDCTIDARFISVPSKKMKSVALNRLAYLNRLSNCTPEMIQSVHGCYGKIFKRQLIIGNNIYFDENLGLGEDLLFYINVLETSTTILLTDIPLYIICENKHSSTRSYNSKMPEYAAKAIKILARYWDDTDYKRLDVSEAILNHLEVAIQSSFAHKKNPVICVKRAEAFEKYVKRNEIADIISKSADCIIRSCNDLIIKRKCLLSLLKARKYKIFMFIKVINNQIKR